MRDEGTNGSGRGVIRLVIATALAVGAVWAAFEWPTIVARFGYALEAGKAEAAAEKLASGDELGRAYRNVAQTIKPSLVFITASKDGPRLPIRRPNRIPGAPGGDDAQTGLGSGVVVSDDGLILTNNHVVSGADRLEVLIAGGEKLQARIVGTDPATDVAVIRVDRKGLRPAKLGDSDRIEVGDIVMAAGCPFGLDQTITQGIISAIGRSNLGVTAYEDFLQTDCAINPGNSGGPLVNLRGEVIGINTAIFSRSGGYQGIGFAIPINQAKVIMGRLIKDGKVRRGFLGVSIQNLTADLRENFGYKGDAGVLVTHADGSGPAAKAGVRAGDILLAVAGKPVTDVNSLRNAVAGMEPGSTVALKVHRDGKEVTYSAVLAELPGELVAAGGNGEPKREDQPAAAEPAGSIGAKVQTLDARTARVLGIPLGSGVVVTEVTPGSPASEGGLTVGDIVSNVGDKPCKTAEEFADLLSGADLAKGVRLLVRSQGTFRFVVVRKR